VCRGSSFREIRSAIMSDSELRQALLGTWRLVSLQTEVDGTLVKPPGESPHGYLVYTSDGHVVVQFAARERAELLGSSPGKRARAPRNSESQHPVWLYRLQRHV
jgi:hypothetical protein